MYNENWGWLSTEFPNRTKAWERCTTSADHMVKKQIYDFLDHPMVIALIVNQHHNYSHPKLINVPLGVADSDKIRKMIRERGRANVLGVSEKGSKESAPNPSSRDSLMFVAGSDWGYRPRIARCVEGKLNSGEFVKPAAKLRRLEYYDKICQSKFGLSMPGLGFDTYR